MENTPASLDFQDVKSGPDLPKVVIVDSIKMYTKVGKRQYHIKWISFELLYLLVSGRTVSFYTLKEKIKTPERANHLDSGAVPRS